MSDAGKAAAAAGADKGAAASSAAAAAQAGKGAEAGKGAAGAADKGKEQRKPANILEGSADDLQEGARGAEDRGDETARAAAAAVWPDDWREQMSGGDEKLAGLLKRYASPQSVATALNSLRTKLDAGGFRKPLAKDATEDEIKAYRKDNQIPETWEDYELPGGLEVAEADKPIIEAFLQHAHGKNYSPDVVGDMVSWYFAARGQENDLAYERDEQVKSANDDVLREKWGPDYKGNLNGTKNYLVQALGEKEATDFFGARMPNGELVGNNVKILDWLANTMREISPDLVSRGHGADAGGKGIQDRINEIEKVMRENRASYDKDEKLQAEYLQLLRDKEKIDARNTNRKAA